MKQYQVTNEFGSGHVCGSYRDAFHWIAHQWLFDDGKHTYQIIEDNDGNQVVAGVVCRGKEDEMVVTRILPAYAVSVYSFKRHSESGDLLYEVEAGFFKGCKQATDLSKRLQ